MIKFFCSNNNIDKADIVMIGLPFDATSSFRAGSRFAPDDVRVISESIESYSPYLDKDLEDIEFYDAGNIDITISNFEKLRSATRQKIDELLSQNKKVLSIGGEHLVTLPLIESYHKKYPNLKIIHFDAHADLRDEYLGEKFSHATVLRRVAEIVGSKNIYQFGIRSGTKEEFEYGKNNTNFFPFEMCVENVVDELQETPIYLTIDLDVLDPSIFPGTGTPEPGGICFSELLTTIKKLNGLNIVGIDAVELSPSNDTSRVSSIATAKIIRELLLSF
jgi:agmatinase